jgi:hypothetical protein
MVLRSGVRKDTSQRMQDVLDKEIRARAPTWSDAYHAEARRLRGLYNVGGASDLVTSSLPSFSNYPSHPPGLVENKSEDRPYVESPRGKAAKARRKFAADAKAGVVVKHRDPWYTSGMGLGSTAPLAVRTRYDARPEMVARRADLHSLKHVALPVDEWVPPILSGTSWDGYTKGPRNWPREAEYVTRSDYVDQRAKMSLSTDTPSRPSYVRETTVPHSMSQLQMALADPQAQRGNRRVAQRDAARHARILTDALEERKIHQLRHASWLETSGDKVSRSNALKGAVSATSTNHGATPGMVKRSTYALDQAAHMGVMAGPSNVYRELMRQKGSGVKASDVTRTSKVQRLGTMSAVLQPSTNELYQRGGPLAHDDQLIERAIARKLKARKMRFEVRLQIVGQVLATLHKSPSAAPGNQQIIRLHQALRRCGIENINPLVIARAQFTPIILHTLGDDGITPHMADMLYSAFDPDRRDRARYTSICCGMMMANRPEVYKLIGSTGSDHGKFADTLPVLRSVYQQFDVEDTGITPNDCYDLLMLPALHEDDILAMGALWSETAKLFGIPPRDKLQRIKWDIFIGVLSKQPGCPLLKEIQRQLKAYQSRVHEFTAAAQTRATDHAST